MGLFRRKPKKQPLDRIGAFGKLPFTPEFIKSYGGHPFVKAWDQWFQKAYTALHYDLGEHCKQYLHHMPDYQFLHYNGPKESPYIGSVFNRRDAGGRRYPFVIVRQIRTPLAWEFAGTLPLFYDDFLAYSEYWVSQHSHDLSMKQLHQSIQNMRYCSYPLEKSKILPYTLEQLKSLTVQDLMGNDFDNQQELLAWQQCQQTWIKQCHYILSSSKEQVIKLPIRSSKSLRAVVVFYLQLLHELINLNSLNWQLYWQYGNDNQTPQCYLSLRDIKPQEWQVFVNPDYILTNCYVVPNNSDTCISSTELVLSSDMDLLKAVEYLVKNTYI